jgi:ribosomal protein L21E
MLGAIEEAVNVGDKVAQTINPAIPTVNLSNKGNTVTLKVAGKLAETQAESQSEFGMLGAIEEAVNVGDKVAQTINPAIPTVNLSNKGNTVTLKVAGKI